ncbi:class I SAM-dependent methyltransferase [Nonomuraea sp. 3N208]|uniref:class I SAM-dependent methyltransferase n=1 Tax=Nonomuraea sp. 3N208 TaxID=3457421 RepID=UPI003FD1FF6B
MMHEVWARGDAYDSFMGRWSRRVAASFVSWLAVPAGRRWLDAGCGTGALSATVLAAAHPAELTGVDPSDGLIGYARAQITDPRTRFETGDAMALPFPDGRFDVVTSGLVLNFVPEPARAMAEFTRVATSGATVAAYVWDYAEGMAMLRHFWDAATALDPAAAALDEGRRFPQCRPEPLRELWAGAGLADVVVEAIEVPTVFRDFDDYWAPFLGGQAPAPGYVGSLPEDRKADLRDMLRRRLPARPDGSIALTARAWAVRGHR